MRLNEAKQVAEGFGRSVWSMAHHLDIEGLMLFGSTARNQPTPDDVDILVMHHNPVLRSIESCWKRRGCKSDTDRLIVLEGELLNAGYGTLSSLRSQAGCMKALGQGVLNVTYLHQAFFMDPSYEAEVKAANVDPNFYENIFGYGLLWNAESGQFDTPAEARMKMYRAVV